MAGFHNRMQSVLWKAAKERRENIARLDEHPNERPSFAQGTEWPKVRNHNIKQSEWDEKCAEEHAEYDDAVRELLKHKLPNDESA